MAQTSPSSRSTVTARQVTWITPSRGSSQPSTSALAWCSTEKGNLGLAPIHTSRRAGLLLWDESQGVPAPLIVHSPFLQRQQALAPPLSWHHPPPRSVTRGPWWAAGPWQCVGQLDWSWLPIVSSLFSEYLPNQRRKRKSAGMRQGYGDPRHSSVVGKGMLQPGCG